MKSEFFMKSECILKHFFVISFVATKEIKILFKPDEDASIDDLRSYVENLNEPAGIGIKE